MRLCLAIVAILAGGCTTRQQSMQTWSGTVCGEPVNLEMREVSKSKTGPDIKQLVQAGIQASQGNMIAALTSVVDGASADFDARLDASMREIDGRLTTTQQGAGAGGALAAILLLAQQIIARRQRRNAQMVSKDQADVASMQTPPVG